MYLSQCMVLSHSRSRKSSFCLERYFFICFNLLVLLGDNSRCSWILALLYSFSQNISLQINIMLQKTHKISLTSSMLGLSRSPTQWV